MLDVKGKFIIEIRRKDGTVEVEEFDNTVTNEGKVYLLKCGVSNQASQITSWYVGIFGNNVTPSASDTASTALGSSGTYGEITAYSETTRPQFNASYFDTPTPNINNYASIAEFTISGSITARGAFIVSSSVKNSTSGVLMCAGRLASDKPLSSGDVLGIKYSITV